jgi:hypothetical protein
VAGLRLRLSRDSVRGHKAESPWSEGLDERSKEEGVSDWVD